MLNVFVRRAAPWACAWMLGMPSVHAAEAAAPEAEGSVPFRHYQGWRDEPPLDWRQANERVGEIGGWRTYLRESQQGGDDRAGQDDHGRHGH